MNTEGTSSGKNNSNRRSYRHQNDSLCTHSYCSHPYSQYLHINEKRDSFLSVESTSQPLNQETIQRVKHKSFSTCAGQCLQDLGVHSLHERPRTFLMSGDSKKKNKLRPVYQLATLSPLNSTAARP